MYLVINKCVTAAILSNFSRHYLRNRSTLDTDVLGYIGVFQLKEHSPEVWHIPPGTPCITYPAHVFVVRTRSALSLLGSKVKYRTCPCNSLL